MSHSEPPVWWNTCGAYGTTVVLILRLPMRLNVLELGGHPFSLGRQESESRGWVLSPGQFAMVEPFSTSHHITAWDPTPRRAGRVAGGWQRQKERIWEGGGGYLLFGWVEGAAYLLFAARSPQEDSSWAFWALNTVDDCCTRWVPQAPRCFCEPVFSLQ